MAKLRVAFAGCGRISDLHAAAYLGDPDAELLGIYDLDGAAAARKAAEWGVPRVYASYGELLADSEIDAVEVLVPQLEHEAMSVAALRAGKHVSVQKPMAMSLPSADRMIGWSSASPIFQRETGASSINERPPPGSPFARFRASPPEGGGERRRNVLPTLASRASLRGTARPWGGPAAARRSG